MQQSPIWSVYYQWGVARQWCVLCLTVQALLWVEFYVAFGLFGFPADAGSWLNDGNGLKIGVVAFLITPVFWIWVKPQLQKAVPYPQLLREFQKLKFDKKYVELLFSEQPVMIPIFSGMKTSIIGNKYAPNTLTVVTNPLCGPCVRMHSQLVELISQTHTTRHFLKS